MKTQNSPACINERESILLLASPPTVNHISHFPQPRPQIKSHYNPYGNYSNQPSVAYRTPPTVRFLSLPIPLFAMIVVIPDFSYQPRWCLLTLQGHCNRIGQSRYLHAKSFHSGVEWLLVRAMSNMVSVSLGTAVVFDRGGTGWRFCLRRICCISMEGRSRRSVSLKFVSLRAVV